MVLFIVVAVGLYLLYTKPSIVPGRRVPSAEHPVSYTAVPGNPTVTEITENPAAAPGNSAAERAMAAESAKSGESENAVIEGGE